jgi:hypothetical protein
MSKDFAAMLPQLGCRLLNHCDSKTPSSSAPLSPKRRIETTSQRQIVESMDLFGDVDSDELK